MVASGRVLSLGYYDHPPASWWLSWARRICSAARRRSWCALPFIALFALSTWLMYRLGAAITDAQGRAVGGSAAEPVAGVRGDHRYLGAARRAVGLRSARRCSLPRARAGARCTGMVAWSRDLRRSGTAVEILGGSDCGGRGPVSAVEPAPSALAGNIETMARCLDRVADVRAGAGIECSARLGLVQLSGGACYRHAPPAACPAGYAGRRGAVRAAMALAADDGGVHGGAASRSDRVAVVAVVLPGCSANCCVRGGLRLVESAGAVPLGGARLSDAVSAAG